MERDIMISQIDDPSNVVIDLDQERRKAFSLPSFWECLKLFLFPYSLSCGSKIEAAKKLCFSI